jgi:response regulator RpfG family c-di-GMP phosphodiesterase
LVTPEKETLETPLAALVVDDDPAIRRLCRALLEAEDWSVREVSDGAEAVIDATNRPPDVIIMDVMMPKVDGLKATQRIRAHPVTAQTPIIMLSALGATTDVLAGLEAGADDYITKPLIPKEFTARVNSVRRLRRAWRELHRSYDVLGEHVRSLNLLLDFSLALAHTEELGPILDRTLEVTATLAASRRISIMLPDVEKRRLKIVRSIGLDRETADRIVVEIGEAIAGRVFATGQPILIHEASEAEAFCDAPDRGFFDEAPMVSTVMRTGERTVGVLSLTNRVGGRRFTEQTLEYLNLVCGYAASAIQNALSREARNEAHDSIVIALAKLAEHRDKNTGKHLERVTMFCLSLAEELRKEPEYAKMIDADFLENLRRAAPLHDIGKVAIPDAILLKPGKLTESETTVMRTHVKYGVETIRSVLARTPNSRFLKMAEEITHGHHAWFDGSGYPDGAHGGNIPLAARILALADVYDAITTKRPYKQAMPHCEALDIIVKHSGTQFDPAIVQAFLRLESEFRQLTIRLSDDASGDEATTALGSGREKLCLVPIHLG